MTLAYDDLYSRDPARIDALLDEGEDAWNNATAQERFALETAMAATRSRLTQANGRVLLNQLTRPRPAWTRWMCACAGPPHVTGISPGFERLLGEWARNEPAMVEPLSLLLRDADIAFRRFAQSACAHVVELADCGGPAIVEGLWHGEAEGDYMAGLLLAEHALRHGPHSALERVLQAPKDAARGAVFAVDRTPGAADLEALQPILEHLEKKGAKASKECASRLLARLHASRSNREALLPRLFKKNASIRAQTAAGLRNAARAGIDIAFVQADLERVVAEATGFRKRAAQEALNASGPDRIVVRMGSAGSHLHATIDLDAGILERSGQHLKASRYRIAPETLAMLRRRATSAHSRGDHHVREQFAMAGVSYTFHLGGTPVTWEFEIAGNRTDPLVEPIYDYVATTDAKMAPVRID